MYEVRESYYNEVFNGEVFKNARGYEHLVDILNKMIDDERYYTESDFLWTEGKYNDIAKKEWNTVDRAICLQLLDTSLLRNQETLLW